MAISLLPEYPGYTLAPPINGSVVIAMARYYTLAKAAEITPYSSGFPWPYEVSVCFDPVRYPIVMTEGVAHGAAATTLTAVDALQDRWQQHFAKSKGAWLVPIISRMAAGENVAADEAVSAYKAIHNQDPISFEANI
jgi:hypothetical protein